MTLRRKGAIAAGVAAVLVVVAAALVATGDDETAVSSDTTTTSVPAPETTTTAPTTTTVVDTLTAVWPPEGSAERYHDPVEAARAFAVELVGFDDPIVGELRAGDARSGEVEVRGDARGAVTTVFVRQLDDEGHWWVLGASTPDIVLTGPSAGDLVTSPVTVAGRARAFEGTVLVRVLADGVREPIGAAIVTASGSEELGDFRELVPYQVPGARAGALVLLTESARDGAVWQASVVRIRFADPGAPERCRPAPPPATEAGQTRVTVHFPCGPDGRLVAVDRVVPATRSVLRATVEQQLVGPTPAERAAGLSSWFSPETAGMLRSVDLDPDGSAVVDFDPALMATIPNASTSAGSALLLAQLDATVLGVDGVERVEYRAGGSCSAFYEWLQMACPSEA